MPNALSQRKLGPAVPEDDEELEEDELEEEPPEPLDELLLLACSFSAPPHPANANIKSDASIRMCIGVLPIIFFVLKNTHAKP